MIGTSAWPASSSASSGCQPSGAICMPSTKPEAQSFPPGRPSGRRARRGRCEAPPRPPRSSAAPIDSCSFISVPAIARAWASFSKETWASADSPQTCASQTEGPGGLAAQFSADRKPSSRSSVIAPAGRSVRKACSAASAAASGGTGEVAALFIGCGSGIDR